MSTKVGEKKYKCNVCGNKLNDARFPPQRRWGIKFNEVVVTNALAGELVLCGQLMANAGEGFQCK